MVLIGLLIFVLVLVVSAPFRSGHIVLFPEVRGDLLWQSEPVHGDFIGGWQTEDVLVYVSTSDLIGFSANSGEEIWNMGMRDPICGMTAEVHDGFGLVLIEGDIDARTVPGLEDQRPNNTNHDGPAYSCDVAVWVDLETGAEVWRTEALADESHDEAALLFTLDPRAEVAGGQVLVQLGAELVALDLGSGTELWRRSAFGAGEGDCPAADFMVRDATEVVVAADCDTDLTVNFHVLDPATGTDVSLFAFDRGPVQEDSVYRARLVATEPIHAWIDLGHPFGVGAEVAPDTDTEEWEGEEGEYPEPTIGFTDDGDVLHHFENRSLFDRSDASVRFVVVGDRLYSSTGGGSCESKVRAHDLGTGALLWETEIPDPTTEVVSVREGRLLVTLAGLGSFAECTMFRPFTPGWDWQLYTLNVDTGEPSPLSRPLDEMEMPQRTALWWEDGRMYQIEHPTLSAPGRVIAYE